MESLAPLDLNNQVASTLTRHKSVMAIGVDCNGDIDCRSRLSQMKYTQAVGRILLSDESNTLCGSRIIKEAKTV